SSWRSRKSAHAMRSTPTRPPWPRRWPEAPMPIARPGYDKLIFELSRPGRHAHSLPECDVPVSDPAQLLPAQHLRASAPELPEVSEVDVIRHYSRLSQMNYGVDTHFYPLGSCTMKYNPKINEDMARLPGFARLHPLAPESASQGALQLMYELAGDLADLERNLSEDVAAFMITQPNTLGLFESRIHQITEMCHARGVQVYMDGANFNAILGITRPGDLGFDVCHFNLHKTFTTPHGGGGPGAGPVGVKAHLEPFLPVPVVTKDGEEYALDWKRPRSIGKLQAFWGNFGMLVRAYTYIRTMGPDGLRSVADNAILNASYIMKRLEQDYDVAVPGPCMHECVLSARRQKKLGVTATDIAKRLLDLGFYAPSTYFPLIVEEALMIEPTETEAKETLDAFCDAMIQIARE